MKFLDLFAGIGGFHLGMEQAGHQCVGWVEWDKFARQSYQAIHNVKGVWNASDIRTVRASELPRADCWCFGFPCQDISVAGKQKGFTAGKRSSLFFTVTGLIRDLEEEDRPRYLLIENVKNLLSINRGLDFLKLQIELDEIGYDVEWDVLDSAEVVSQHRERIFIIGHLRGRRTRKVFPIIRKNGKNNKTIKEVAKMYPNRHSSDANSVIDPSGISHTVTAHSYKDSPKIVVNQLGNISNSKSFGGNPQIGRVYGTDGISPTLSTMQGGGQEPKIAIPVSSPDIISKKQNGRRFKKNGDPEFALTVRDRHGVLTNGNNPKVAVREATKKGYDVAQLGDSINFAQPNSKTRRGRVGHGVANTLTTAVEQATLTDDLKIRKLTPLECWRLQGFPDWAFIRAREAGLSDSQLYKQAGNSVTVPIIKAIADRMELK
ncbi:DNA (cytosine-5-)-methyltransferase [Lactiplantibacillus plantarum]|uniref:DNA (cytosine-5-)-methyltransferase n=1 Tax=Lactiplantibacillus plantarum TaxID=1590 RepID=UPI0009419B98|nr:DNA (cytosine-5-)-methyltransferase [Lactiplantibacillus plantarum]MBC6382375.1 DNA (cytosine-5-)-methyltransferase [Lactiplantibacillus plantarum]